nr:MAG TPA: Thaumarchaeal output domain 1 [Caudoviricetes sp.]
MTAEEMFIKLGFTKKITPNTFIMYGRVNTTASRDIVFDKVSRRIAAKDVLGDKLITKSDISANELMAIIQQCIELGWLEEETCTNESEYDSRDVFKCSNCGFISVHHTGLKIDEDNRVESYYGYRPKYCPNCGSKIID